MNLYGLRVLRWLASHSDLCLYIEQQVKLGKAPSGPVNNLGLSALWGLVVSFVCHLFLSLELGMLCQATVLFLLLKRNLVLTGGGGD